MPWTVMNGVPTWTSDTLGAAGVTPTSAPTAADPYLQQAGVALPKFYTANDRGQSQYNYYKDEIAKATPDKMFSSDLTDLFVMKELNGAQDPFFLKSLTDIVTSANVDSGTKGLASRTLYQVNQERKAAGLAPINAPGSEGFTKTAPVAPGAFTQVAPKAPTFNQSAPAAFTERAPDRNSYIRKNAVGKSTLDPAYQVAFDAYNARLQAYNASVTKYNADYAAYQANLPTLQATYNQQNTAYQSALQAYQASVNKYQADNAQFQQDKQLYDATAAAQDTVLAASGTRAKQLAKDQLSLADREEQVRKMDMIHSSLQGISRFYAGRAATTITPSSALIKKTNTLGGV